jgi:mRNA interferase MazF
VARILRGEIRWAELAPTRGDEQAGLRPVLVLSEDVFNDRSGTVIAVALTSQEPRAGFPLTLESSASGLPKRSWIKISQIRTLSTEHIGRRIARSSDAEMSRVIEGLNEILGAV